jgi:hypothetical protein
MKWVSQLQRKFDLLLAQFDFGQSEDIPSSANFYYLTETEAFRT